MERETILSRIAELAKMPNEELKKLWLELYQKEAPPFNRSFLEARLAYRLQEMAFGGITDSAAEKLKIQKSKTQEWGYKPPIFKPAIGTVIVKEHKGVLHRVRTLHDGFDYEGIKYTSLSAVAKVISGCNCSGVRFFGFKGQGQKS